MPRQSHRRRSGGASTRRARSSSSHANKAANKFAEHTIPTFLDMLMTVKLFHWKTTSYAAHKASDDLYTQLNLHIDSFVEILLGKSGSRVSLPAGAKLSLVDTGSTDALRNRIEQFKSFLVSMDDQLRGQAGMSNTDLLNVRDSILGDMNQFLYLLTFHG